MTVFKFSEYPNVCRLCLRSIPKGSTISLDTFDPIMDDTVGQFIATAAYTISETKSHLLPQQICQICYQSLKSFATFRSKMVLLHQLMDAMVEVKRGNNTPAEDLFIKRPELGRLLRAMGLCSKDNVRVDDLLEEFPSYAIAGITDEYEVQLDELKEEPIDELTLQTLIVEQIVPPDADDDFEPMVTSGVVDDFKPDMLIPLAKTEFAEPLEMAEQCESLEEKVSEVEQSVTENVNSIKTIRAKKTKPDNDPNTPNDNYDCLKCGYKTTNKYRLKAHERSHLKKESKRYACPEPGCSEVFVKLRVYQIHKANHRQYTCEQCGSQFKTATQLKDHVTRHDDTIRPIACEYCNYTGKVKTDLTNHMRFRHERVTFTCTICELPFSRKTILKDHMNIHTKEKQYPCPICEKVFYVRSYLKRHVKVVHERKRIMCDYCPKVFIAKDRLMDHVEMVHGVQLRFVCEICLNQSASQTALDTHKLRHENPKELECGRCLNLHNTEESLKSHLCITYRDNYDCCGRDQRHYMQYNKHMFLAHGVRTNVRVKPVPGELVGVMRLQRKRIESCAYCEMIFETRTLKKKHMETCGKATENTNVV